VLGALAGWGVSKQHILTYEQQLRSGKYLVIAHGTEEDIVRAQKLLGHTEAAQLTARAA
jgi:hypothetical protein